MRRFGMWKTTIWNKIKLHPVIFGVALLFLALLLFAYLHFVLGFIWAEWTGFGEYQIIKIDPTTNQPTEIQMQSRSLWDWLQLLVVPLVLAVGGLWFNSQQKYREQNFEKDRQREAALQTYLDKMSELLLDKELVKKKDNEDDPTVGIAQTRTVTTLRILDMGRRNILLQFLKDANLSSFILKRAPLSGADLARTHLSNAALSEANLMGADLTGSDLYFANMKGANLSSAVLSWANLSRANLSEANLISANLRRAILIEANLTKATLWGGTNLSETILMGADLSEANLSGADLTGADLTGANFSLAHLYAAKVTQEQLSTVSSLKGATMPDGTKHP